MVHYNVLSQAIPFDLVLRPATLADARRIASNLSRLCGDVYDTAQGYAYGIRGRVIFLPLDPCSYGSYGSARVTL